MTTAFLQAKGSVRPRAGAPALSLLSDRLSVDVLRQLERGRVPLIQLRRAVGSPPQTTMRAHLKLLTEVGALVRTRQRNFPGSVDYELGAEGRDLLGVAEALQAWLQGSPAGHVVLGGIAAKRSIRSLVEGWSSSIVQGLAAGPLSLTDLNRSISDLNYPSIERRLVSMRVEGLIEATPSDDRGIPYVASDWLRRAVVPIVAACFWEQRHVSALAPAVGSIDVEAGFLLAAPLVRLPAEISGSCSLAVELRGGDGGSHVAGVLIELRAGRVASCVTRLQGRADASAAGPLNSWFPAVMEGDTRRLEISGDRRLITQLLDAFVSYR